MLDVVLVLKVALAPALILGASLAGNRWGNTVSGWLVALPLTSAPVVLLLALEQGTAFASRSAEGTMLGYISLSSFSLVFSLLSLRGLGWMCSMLTGWGVYFFLSLVFEGIYLPIAASFAGVVAWLLLVAWVFPKCNSVGDAPFSRSGWKDVTARMVAALGLVFAITEGAPLLGPRLSGLLTPFPIYTSVLAASISRGQGAGVAIQFVRGATIGLFTAAVFFLVVGTLIVGWGVGVSYGVAMAVSMIIHWLVLGVLRKRT